MRVLRRTVAVVTAVTLPFVTGCFGLLPVPVPASPGEREQLDVRGVVVAPRGGGDEERVTFSGVEDVRWTPEGISIVGVPRSGEGAGRMTERRFSLSDLSGVLVHQVDPARTSAVIGGLIVGTAAIVALLVTGRTENIISPSIAPWSR